MNDAITQAKQIDEQSKQAEFYQEALDQIAKRGFANARFETDIEEGLDVLAEYYPEYQQNWAVEQKLHLKALYRIYSGGYNGQSGQ